MNKYSKKTENEIYYLIKKKNPTIEEIANELNKNNILTPATYKRKNELESNNIETDKRWNAKMINKMLKF